MGSLATWMAKVAALGLVMAVPAGASPTVAGAGKIRQLDIMLMVTSLRCRFGSDDFRHEYGQFTSRHLPSLNAASHALRSDMERRHGAAGARALLDRTSTTMANRYGQGHPWLTCADLRMVARSLAAVDGVATLEEAADQLLAPAASRAALALARR